MASDAADALFEGRTPEAWAQINAEVAKRNLNFIHPCELKALEELQSKHAELLKDPLLASRDNRLLVTCLFARKLDIDRTAELLRNYAALRRKYNLLDPVKIEDVDEKLMRGGSSFSVLGKRDKQGRIITYIQCSRVYPAEVQPKSLMGYLLWWFEYFLENEGLDTCRTGVTYIYDLNDMTWKNLGGTSDMKEFYDALQNCLPIRIKSVLLLGASKLVQLALPIFRLFYKKKIMQRVEVITKEDLQQRIDPSQLLAEYGGLLLFNYTEFVASLDPRLKAAPTVDPESQMFG